MRKIARWTATRLTALALLGSVAFAAIQTSQNAKDLAVLRRQVIVSSTDNQIMFDTIRRVFMNHRNALEKLTREIRGTQGNLKDLDGRLSESERLRRENILASLNASVRVSSDYGKDASGRNRIGRGSGTIIRSNSTGTYIITAYHVVDILEQDPAWVPKDQRRPGIKPKISIEIFGIENNSINKHSAELLFFDKDRDLAVLKVKDWFSPHVVDLMGKEKAKKLHVLDEVYAVGCPLGVTPRVSNGELTATHHAQAGYLEANCQIIWGNSGGGLYQDGKLIGVTVMVGIARYQAVESLGIHVHILAVHNFLETNGFMSNAS